MTEEIWKEIPDWPYEVSNLGRVRRTVRDRMYAAGRICAQHPTNHQGYLQVTLCDKPRRKHFAVSRLVCTAFHGPPPSPDHEADHQDKNPGNNRAANLRWLTWEENNSDRVPAKGECVGSAKLTADDVPRIRSAPFRELKTLADELGVHISTLKSIRAGRRWRHIPFPPDHKRANNHLEPARH